MNRRIGLLSVLAAIALIATNASSAGAATVVSCPFLPSGGGGDRPDRGFYVSGYPGLNIDQVTLEYNASAAGTYTFTLTARSGSYDGPIIGTATTSIPLAANSAAEMPVSYAFGGVPVASGSTVTFAQTFTGPGLVHFNTGVGPCPGVTETNGTTPPLDTFRRDSVGVTITGATGQRAAALKKCKQKAKKKHWTKKRLKKCKRKARLLPV